MVFKKEKLRKKVIWMVLAFLMLIPGTGIAFAQTELPDLQRDIDVNLTFKSTAGSETGKPMEGAKVHLYRVGDLTIKNGKPYYVINDNFKNLKSPDLNNMTSADSLEFADRCSAAANSDKADAIVKTDSQGSTGTIKLGKKHGIYLVVVKDQPKEFKSVKPYILRLPDFTGTIDNGTWNYSVSAIPKIALSVEFQPSEKDNPPAKGTPPVRDKAKTGDSQHPEIYLSILGIAVLGIIIISYTRSRKDSVEH